MISGPESPSLLADARLDLPSRLTIVLVADLVGTLDATGRAGCHPPLAVFHGRPAGRDPAGRRPGATRAVAFKAAPYSSSGPTQQQQRMPSASYMTDQSPALPGIRAAGVRSGTRVRLVGTSMASPQLARDLATPKVPPPHTLVGPQQVPDKVTKPPQVPRLGATTETTVEDFLPRA